MKVQIGCVLHMYLTADWLKWPDVQQASRMRYPSKHTCTDTPSPRTTTEHGVALINRICPTFSFKLFILWHTLAWNCVTLEESYCTPSEAHVLLNHIYSRLYVLDSNHMKYMCTAIHMRTTTTGQVHMLYMICKDFFFFFVFEYISDFYINL